LIVFVIVGFGTAFLSQSQRRAVQRSDREASLRRSAELEERAERQRFETTLASIGDGVVATDSDGRVRFMNPAAEALTGWNRDEAAGKPLQTVFQSIDEETRKPADNPALRAIREGGVVAMVERTVLIARDGREIPIDESS